MIISQITNNDELQEPLETNMNKSSKVLLWGRRNQRQSFGIENPIWKYKALKIIILVSRFLFLITQQIFRKDLTNISKSEFNLIHDASSDYDFFKYRGDLPKDKPSYLLLKLHSWFSCIICKQQNTFLQKNHKKWLLKPDDTIMIVWNVTMIVIVTINVFYVSLRISFPEIRELSLIGKELIFEQIPVYIFFIDIILKLNTCIYFRGNLISNRKKIIKHYCAEGLIIDLVLVVPFFIGQLLNFSYLDFVIVLKVFQLSGLFSSLFNRLELTSRQTAIFDLFKMISFMILVAHFSACIWHILGQWGEWGHEDGKTWIKSWLDRYVVSFYWSIVTMTTIGYGDITPVNLTERIFVIFMTMISSATFAYTVNNIGGIFQDFSKQSVQLKNNMNQLNRFLRSQNVSDDLQIKFRRYFEYLWSKPSQKVIQFAELIPKSLKDQMIVDVNIKILNQISFFQQFSQPLLNKLCMNLEEKQIQSNDYLFTRNKQSLQLYILVSGEIKLQIQFKDKPKLLQRLDAPSFVGQLDFFNNQPYSYDAIASKATKILHISRETLHNIYKDFPLDYEKYKQISEDIVQHKQLSHISVICNTCQSNTHFINSCPFLFGTPNRAKAIYKYRKFTPCDRKPDFQRHNHSRKMYALKHQFIVLESILNYMMKNEEFIHIEGFKELQMQTQQFQNNQFTFNQIPIGLSVHHSNNSVLPPLLINSSSKQSQSQRILQSVGNLLPPQVEDSPRTFRNNQIINTTNLRNYHKLSINHGSQSDLPKVEDEVPIIGKFQKKNDVESLCVNNDNQQQQQLSQQQYHKQLNQQHQQLQILPQIQINQVGLRRKSVRLKREESSEDDNDDSDQIMGQHIDIFQQFERMQEFNNYYPHNNISIVVNKYQERIFGYMRQIKKRKSRKQETLLHLLKQAQGKQRL
ncbi:unnamed protein product (macronuclear) [Paramecium tetraurelia]|uniref:Cyclic nucleotide-binding domain-containing protein n=1 Tax=Paramecium tetraurelia TaxID=5888 RepID=A0DHY9_PARTE|nr:uncharacterized protein GSPATT00017027001 [Paramecium tetraurelia]CAK82656.1 unnamed protein product [Paramecium tetraurelia]|eukprot:XP_001450053.1 hypothetical protein (macronuclear) [Paramecium tetraurelia strain d4-2]